MKISKLAVIFFILTIKTYAQSKIVNIEYEIFYNVELPNTKMSNLYIDNVKNISMFKIQQSSQDSTRKNKRASDGTVISQLKSKIQEVNFVDYGLDSIYSTENIFGGAYIISEQIPKIKWELTSEEKMIDKNKVKKATCYFRGRNYIAWYSVDFPLKYGPWKFNGLPGLIFEIYDETRRYNWTVKSITPIDINDDIFQMPSVDSKRIEIEEYAKMKFNATLLTENLASKLPRGAEIIVKEIPKTGMEIKFEWEK